MIDLTLLVTSSVTILILTVIEWYTILTGQPTISARVQRWSRSNRVWVAPICGLVIGLLIHFFG
jgi:hypothetical protein